MTNNEVPTMLTIPETAKKSGLPLYYIRGLCASNKIVNVKCGRKFLINFEKLLDFLNTGETSEPPLNDSKIRKLG